MAFTPYVWDANDTNTAPLPSPLLSDGYALQAIPTSTEFNELWRNVSGLIAAVNSLFRPGTIVSSFNTAPMAGWLQLQDGSIGSATSGGTLLADPSAEALYTVLWDSIADAEAPVAGGRGASAAADFAANKHITLPATNGRVLVNGQGFYTHGSVFGSSTHTLSVSETPPHTHLQLSAIDQNESTPGGNFNGVWGGGTHQVQQVSNGSEGGLAGSPHNINQASVSVFHFIKL